MRERLVGERIRHHERRMSGAATEVHQAAFGEHDQALAVGEYHVVDLRLDVVPCVLLQARDFDFGIEVADVAHDGVVFHALHVVVRDDGKVAGGGDENVGLVGGIVHRHDAETFHRRLQCADRIDLGDPHLRRQGAQRFRAAFADVAVTGDDRDLAGDHHVGCAFDRIDQRFAAAVQVVELRFRDRVVDVDRRERQAAFILHFVEAMHAGRGLFGHALDVGLDLRVETGLCLERLAHRRKQHDFFFVAAFGRHGAVPFVLGTQRHQQGRVSAVIENHVGGAAVRPFQNAVRVIPIVFERLALVGKHRDAARRDGRSRVVLRRKNIARSPADIGAE